MKPIKKQNCRTKNHKKADQTVNNTSQTTENAYITSSVFFNIMQQPVQHDGIALLQDPKPLV